MGLETAAIIGLAGAAMGAGSTIYGAHQTGKQQGRAQDFRDQIARRAEGHFQNDPWGFEADVRGAMGQGPSAYEQQFADLLGASPVPFGQQFNTGQDALMQMFRAQPYDMTDLYASLEPIENRLINEQVAGLQGSSSGLGQRFGSALMREEGNMRQRAAEDQAARREQLGFQAYEASQGRRMGAADAMARYGLGADQARAQYGLANRQLTMGGYGQLMGAEQSRRGMDLSLLQMLAQAQQGRSAHNANILGIMGGYGPQVTGSPYAQAGSDIGQLMMFLPMIMQMQQQG